MKIKVIRKKCEPTLGYGGTGNIPARFWAAGITWNPRTVAIWAEDKTPRRPATVTEVRRYKECRREQRKQIYLGDISDRYYN